jgi:hypothetical protein
MRVMVAVDLGTAAIAAAAAIATPELLKSRQTMPMTNGVVYRASLFAPGVLVKTTAPGWEGGQYVAMDYHRLQLVYRGNDVARGGGMNIVSAPGSARAHDDHSAVAQWACRQSERRRSGRPCGRRHAARLAVQTLRRERHGPSRSHLRSFLREVERGE